MAYGDTFKRRQEWFKKHEERRIKAAKHAWAETYKDSQNIEAVFRKIGETIGTAVTGGSPAGKAVGNFAGGMSAEAFSKFGENINDFMPIDQNYRFYKNIERLHDIKNDYKKLNAEGQWKHLTEPMKALDSGMDLAEAGTDAGKWADMSSWDKMTEGPYKTPESAQWLKQAPSRLAANFKKDPAAAKKLNEARITVENAANQKKPKGIWSEMIHQAVTKKNDQLFDEFTNTEVFPATVENGDHFEKMKIMVNKMLDQYGSMEGMVKELSATNEGVAMLKNLRELEELGKIILSK